MTNHLVTFSDSAMSYAADRCLLSGLAHGIGNAIHWSDVRLHRTDFYQRNKVVLDNPRGCGLWAWKPFIIMEAMWSQCQRDDVLVYSDTGVEFVDNVNYIVDRMDQDVWLFGNMYEHAHWCKRDIIEAVWPLQSRVIGPPSAGWEAFGKQVQASVIFFRVTNTSRAFVKEWLDWCFSGARVGAALTFGPDNPQHADDVSTWSEFRYLIDDSPSVIPNHPEFRENRHDQAILTTLGYRDGYKLHWWPAMYHDGAFTYVRGKYPDEGYPVLFHHHRKRNSDWQPQ
jgi:hypothetical protein